MFFWYEKLISDIRKSFSDIRKSELKSYLAFYRLLTFGHFQISYV